MWLVSSSLLAHLSSDQLCARGAVIYVRSYYILRWFLHQTVPSAPLRYSHTSFAFRARVLEVHPSPLATLMPALLRCAL